MNIDNIKTPVYLLDENLLKKNLKILKSISESTGCKILLAQKAFSMFSMYPLLSKYLDGSTASSLHEARLGNEKLGKETHIFAPAYRDDEFQQVIRYCDHIVFNTFSQWQKYKAEIQNCAKKISCGIRVNPEYSEISTDIYNPCFENSRLGTTLENFEEDQLDGIEGLHFHTMCEQNADTLKRTIDKFEEKFGKFLPGMKWVNFGGGHHITRKNYKISVLIDCIEYIQEKYDVQVYIEPGEAIALNAGYLVTEVLDTMKNRMDLAILDSSAACHMPDVLEMPYRPDIIGAGQPGEKKYTYRLGGPTCLAGDIIGDYSFDHPLRPKSRLVFCDMAHYSMVKNNTFNGIKLPSIALMKEDGQIEIIREFGYEDFKNRLS